MTRYTHIIWDWNGTLLDDVAWCMDCINKMLVRRGLPVISTVEAYRDVFGFPVKDYYRRAGFDFASEPFEDLAVEFMELYHGENAETALFPGAREVLSTLQAYGVRQIILSASEAENLKNQIKPFDLDKYFDEILGISHIYATSKIELGKTYIQRVKPDKAVLIGDTAHDMETAEALGVDCILAAGGHHNRASLEACGAPVVDKLADICGMITIN